MKIAILGNGLLGKEIFSQTNWPLISRSENGFDITKQSTYNDNLLEIFHGVIVVNKYDTIINCIAHTDTYSTDKTLHWDINYKGVVQLANFCEKHNTKLVHISTDYVYTNSINEASENDIPIHGNNWYSYTKLLGDSYVQLNPKNLVLRGTHKKYPFPYDKAWINQIGNFDYVHTMANLIIEVVNTQICGLVNIGTNLKTMHDLAKKTNPDIEPIIVSNADVPKNTSMNLTKLKNLINK